MALIDEVSAAIADAMRRQDAPRLSALRMLKAALMNREVEKAHALDDAESRQVVNSLVKQRRDSIEQFMKGGRQDLVDKETAEIAVLDQYLPPPADPAALERAVVEAIAETGAASLKDMGRVMKAAMARLERPDRRRPPRQRPREEEARRRLSAEPRLARSAGVAGVATLTSRILGLVRDQVVLAMFGAGNDMDAFTVAFRIPNLVRDLFAEGAMSAAFVPAFTRHVTLEGKASAWRLGNNVITALIIATGVVVVAGMIFARSAGDGLRRRLRADPREARAHDPTDAADAAVPHARGDRGGDDGDAQLAAPLLRAGAVAGDVQRGDDRSRRVAHAGHVRGRPAADHLHRRRRARRRGHADPRAVACAPRAKGSVIVRSVDWHDPALRRVLVLMGPGTSGWRRRR